jgi:hypothetical protein
VSLNSLGDNDGRPEPSSLELARFVLSVTK